MGLTADFSAGASASAEIGLGMNKKGKKFCYVGTCRGIKIDVSAGVGIALAFWGKKSNVPGKSKAVSMEV